MDIKTAIFPVIEWGRDAKNDDFEVYNDCGYVVVSTTGRNHATMTPFSFNKAGIEKQRTLLIRFLITIKCFSCLFV